MAIVLDAPLTSTITGLDAAQANGLSVDPRGLVAPIPGFIEINAAPDGTLALMARINPTDTITFGGIRSEVDWIPEANAERWYAWDMYLPVGFNPPARLSFMQIHDSPDVGESPVKFPNFEFMVGGGFVTAMVPIDAPSELTSNGRFPAGQRLPLVTGRWVRCALHSNWGTDTSGYLECWYDGQIIAREWSRACSYNDEVGPYLKLGLYNFTGAALDATYTAWFRNLKVYSTGHSQFEVLGAAPVPMAGAQVALLAQ